jgi:hypothetical protein
MHPNPSYQFQCCFRVCIAVVNLLHRIQTFLLEDLSQLAIKSSHMASCRFSPRLIPVPWRDGDRTFTNLSEFLKLNSILKMYRTHSRPEQGQISVQIFVSFLMLETQDEKETLNSEQRSPQSTAIFYMHPDYVCQTISWPSNLEVRNSVENTESRGVARMGSPSYKCPIDHFINQGRWLLQTQNCNWLSTRCKIPLLPLIANFYMHIKLMNHENLSSLLRSWCHHLDWPAFTFTLEEHLVEMYCKICIPWLYHTFLSECAMPYGFTYGMDVTVWDLITRAPICKTKMGCALVKEESGHR